MAAGQKLARGVAVRRGSALLRESDVLHLAGTTVERATKAGEDNDWSEVLKSKRYPFVDEGDDTGVLPRSGGTISESTLCSSFCTSVRTS